MQSILRDSFYDNRNSMLWSFQSLSSQNRDCLVFPQTFTLSAFYIQLLDVQLVFLLKYSSSFSYVYLHFIVTVALYFTIFLCLQVFVFAFFMLLFFVVFSKDSSILCLHCLHLSCTKKILLFFSSLPFTSLRSPCNNMIGRTYIFQIMIHQVNIIQKRDNFNIIKICNSSTSPQY